MVAGNAYELNLKYEGEPLDLDPRSYSFAIVDSIFDSFPKVILTINDVAGFYQEHLFGVEGSNLEIEFGYAKGKTSKLPLVFLSNEIDSVDGTDRISGTVKYVLTHKWYKKQNIKSRAFDDRISSIVREILKSSDFSKININDTGNKSIWYQPLMSDIDFIQKILIPKAYSNNSGRSPFYFFITSNNEANLIHYRAMLNNTVPGEFRYGAGDDQEETINTIFSIKRLHLGSQVTKSYRNIRVFSGDNNGSFNELDSISINDFPSSLSGKVPIIFDSNDFTDYMTFQEKESYGEQENNKGKRINHFKNVIGLEKFVITIPFNPTIVSGKSINLITVAANSTSSDPSLNYSGKYVVEESNHLWAGIGGTGLTKLIISRKTIKAPSSEITLTRKLGG